MTIFESNLSARAFGRALESEAQDGAARLAAIFLSLYVVLRGADLVIRGAVSALWPLDRAGFMFLVEIAVGFIIPIILFTSARVRRNSRWLYHASQLTVLGFVMNRLNVAVTGFEVVTGKTYVPAWSEIAVTLMLVTLGVIAFYLAVRFLPVLEVDAAGPERFRSWRQSLDKRVTQPRATMAGLGGIEGGEG